jgi:hypothetical protein
MNMLISASCIGYRDIAPAMNRTNIRACKTLPPHEPGGRICAFERSSLTPALSPRRGRIAVRWLDMSKDNSGSAVQCAKRPSGKSHPGPPSQGEGELSADCLIHLNTNSMAGS